jgi:spermidine/putrescine transport system permease protein
MHDSHRRAVRDAARGYALLSPTLIAMGLGLVVPMVMLGSYSLWTQHYLVIDRAPTLSNYAEIVRQPMFVALLSRSLLVSAAAAILTVLAAYPVAYFVAFHAGRRKVLWLVLVTAPFWTSYLLRAFAWRIVLGHNGAINSMLMHLGLIQAPLDMLLYTPAAIVLTLVHAWAAFAVLPIFVSLEKIDRSLVEAARDLGDGSWAAFRRVTLPLSAPGIVSAALLVFVPTVGDYVTPALVGGPNGLLIGNVIQSQFGRADDWPLGAALSIVTMAVTALLAATILRLAHGPARAA